MEHQFTLHASEIRNLGPARIKCWFIPPYIYQFSSCANNLCWSLKSVLPTYALLPKILYSSIKVAIWPQMASTWLQMEIDYFILTQNLHRKPLAGVRRYSSHSSARMVTWNVQEKLKKQEAMACINSEWFLCYPKMATVNEQMLQLFVLGSKE